MNEIYKITNLITKKSYIGITSQGHIKRFKAHINEAKRNQYDTYLHRSIRLYGEENFKIELLESYEDREEALSAEISLIRELETLQPNGYNQHEGGKGGLLNPSKEVREKLSAAKKGKPAHNKGKPMSEEQKKKLSDIHKGKPKSEKHKLAMSKARKNKSGHLKFEICGNINKYNKGCRCDLCKSAQSKLYHKRKNRISSI